MSPYFQNIRSKIGHDLLLVPSVAAVIRNDEGELLLQEKSGGTWSLPAGAIEPGETPEEAVRREVLEETGLMVEPTSIRGVFGGSAFRYEYSNGDIVEYTVVLFLCKVLGESADPIDPETISLCYLSSASQAPPSARGSDRPGDDIALLLLQRADAGFGVALSKGSVVQ